MLTQARLRLGCTFITLFVLTTTDHLHTGYLNQDFHWRPGLEVDLEVDLDLTWDFDVWSDLKPSWTWTGLDWMSSSSHFPFVSAQSCHICRPWVLAVAVCRRRRDCYPDRG